VVDPEALDAVLEVEDEPEEVPVLLVALLVPESFPTWTVFPSPG